MIRIMRERIGAHVGKLTDGLIHTYLRIRERIIEAQAPSFTPYSSTIPATPISLDAYLQPYQETIKELKEVIYMLQEIDPIRMAEIRKAIEGVTEVQEMYEAMSGKDGKNGIVAIE